MNRTLWIVSAIMAVFLVVIIGWFFRPTSSSFLTAEFYLNIGWSGSEKSGQGQAIADYQKELKERKSKFDLILFPGDRLGEKESVLEQIRLGSPYLALMTMNEGARYSKNAKVLSLPILFKDQQEIETVLNSEAGEEVRKQLADSGFQVLGWLPVPADPLWIPADKKFPEGLSSLQIGTIGAGFENIFWSQSGARLNWTPQGIWQSESAVRTLEGVIVSSEWMSEKGLFWYFPQRVVVNSVKPSFLVINRELFLSLPIEEQNKLMGATQIWRKWDAKTIIEINFQQIAGKTAVTTHEISPAEYPAIGTRMIRTLDAEEQSYLALIRETLGGRLFFEPEPLRRAWVVPAGNPTRVENPLNIPAGSPDQPENPLNIPAGSPNQPENSLNFPLESPNEGKNPSTPLSGKGEQSL